jgi:LysM repeat protein
MRALLVLVMVLVSVGSQVPVAASGARQSRVYIVQPGDTLGGISLHFAVPLGELARVNGLDPAGVLLAGTKLKVPPTATPSELTMTVKAGDTLSGIASRFGIPLTALSSSNHLDPTAWLFVGQHLVIPGRSSLTASLLDLAAAEASPYPPAVAGVDVSYPDCTRTHTLPSGAGFMIVGLNDGRPFTTNPCFELEYAAARDSQSPASVYLNAAYAPSLIRHVTGNCTSAAEAQPLSRRYRVAYALGCSEARASERMLGGLPAATIWIDIEPANTWSNHPEINRATITGFVDTLLMQDPRPIVGAYSSAAYWRELTGTWTSFPLPEWLATGPPLGTNGCATPFAAGRVWLSQHATTRDHDTSC